LVKIVTIDTINIFQHSDQPICLAFLQEKKKGFLYSDVTLASVE